jgi:hypothetical protein
MEKLLNASKINQTYLKNEMNLSVTNIKNCKYRRKIQKNLMSQKPLSPKHSSVLVVFFHHFTATYTTYYIKVCLTKINMGQKRYQSIGYDLPLCRWIVFLIKRALAL